MLGTPNRTGFHTVRPSLMVVDADGLARFLTAAFDAEVTHRAPGGAGGHHLELQIGSSRVMVGGGGPIEEDRPAALFLYITDLDGLHDRAVAAGSTSIMASADRRARWPRRRGEVDPRSATGRSRSERRRDPYRRPRLA